MAAWAAGGFCALLLGLMLSIISTLEDLQRALKGPGE
jgi:hypothetical protein